MTIVKILIKRPWIKKHIPSNQKMVLINAFKLTTTNKRHYVENNSIVISWLGSLLYLINLKLCHYQKLKFSAKTEDGYRFTFFAKGPNEGYAGRKCAMIHACVLKDADAEGLKWKYLHAEFYDIGDIHRDHRQQIAQPKNLLLSTED